MQNEIEKIMNAAGDGWAESEAWRSAIIAAIERLAGLHGWLIGCQYDGISTYIDCDLESEDGAETIDSFQIRISNHKQAHAGPVWSFQPDHAEKHILMGLREIENRMTNPET